MPYAAQRLELKKADLMKPGSFDEAVADCDAVIHCASPFYFGDVQDPEKEVSGAALAPRATTRTHSAALWPCVDSC